MNNTNNYEMNNTNYELNNTNYEINNTNYEMDNKDKKNYDGLTEEQILKGAIYGGNGGIQSLDDIIKALTEYLIEPTDLETYINAIPSDYALLFRKQIFTNNDIEKYDKYWKTNDTEELNKKYAKLLISKYSKNYYSN